MLRAIQFYDQSRSMAIEIHNVVINHFLTEEANRIAS